MRTILRKTLSLYDDNIITNIIMTMIYKIVFVYRNFGYRNVDYPVCHDIRFYLPRW